MAQLLDQFGNPVRARDLTREVARPEPVNTLASVRRVWNASVATGLTPQRLARILRDCDAGDPEAFVILAEEMEEREPHYFSVLGMRKRAVSGVMPVVVAGSESARDLEIAGAVRRRIAEHPGFHGLVEDLLDALGKGVSAVEVLWGRGRREWWPERFLHRPPAWFVPDPRDGDTLLLRGARPTDPGTPLAPGKWLVHRARLKSGQPHRGALARVVAFGWMCKAYAIKDWMAFIETYGLPLRLGRYGPEATREDVKKLFAAVANIGTDAAAVLPRSMEIDFVENARGGGEAVFEAMARYVDEQISKAVLGQTMTADNGSSKAQAEVHNEVRHDIAAADARAVCATLNRDLVHPFVAFNFGKVEHLPRIRIEIEEPEDTDMVLRNVWRLAQAGVRFRAADIRRRLKMEEPDEDDEVIGGLARSGPPAQALNREQTGAPGAAPDLIDEIAAEMADEWREVMDPLLTPIEELVDGASSYEEVMQGLAGMFGDMQARPIIEALVKAMFKARALGDVRDG